MSITELARECNELIIGRHDLALGSKEEKNTSDFELSD
jgi:hypothetical protein